MRAIRDSDSDAVGTSVDLAEPVDSNRRILRAITELLLASRGRRLEFLADPAQRQDSWDTIKYIRLRQDWNDWFLSMGGEAREIWDQIRNDNWGQQPGRNLNCSAVSTGYKF